MREENREALAKALAGTSAGVLSTCLCSPLDVAKTRMMIGAKTAGGQLYSELGGTPLARSGRAQFCAILCAIL